VVLGSDVSNGDDVDDEMNAKVKDATYSFLACNDRCIFVQRQHSYHQLKSLNSYA